MITQIPEENLLTTKWSGGQTTQLFIWPLNSSFSDRTFDLRISTATVEVEESTFTSLPSYHRVLMILNGTLEITHQHQYTKKITPFEQHDFDGGWATTAKGKVIDFNVIHKPQLAVKVQYQALHAHQRLTLQATQNTFIYCVNGHFTLTGLSNQLINPHQSVLVQNEPACILTAQTNCQLVMVNLPNWS